jgi:hypothetical protein
MFNEVASTVVTLLMPIVTVAAAFIGVVLTNRNNRSIQKDRNDHDKRQHERETKLAAAEEIYTRMEAWAADMRRVGVVTARCVSNGDPVPVEEHRLMMDTARILRSRMLIRVHFPQLDPEYMQLMKDHSRILSASTGEIGDTPEGRSRLILSTVDQLGRDLITFLNSITDQLRALHSQGK